MSAARCGTPSGWSAHQRKGERPCDACWTAKSEYDRRRLAAPELTRRNRDKAKAQQRALKRLKDRHPGEYAIYYAEECDVVRREQQGVPQ